MSIATAPTFAATLARLRTARGLNQGQLADASGLDHTYISRLERGTREPSRETVLVLAAALMASDYDRAVLQRAAGYWPDEPEAAFSIAWREAPLRLYATIESTAPPSVTLATDASSLAVPTGGKP